MAFHLQYVSDIHLEFHDKRNLGKIQPDMFVKPGDTDYLALIGDIGIPERAAMPVFLEWCSQHWKEVFWVPGNHEYYNYMNKEVHTYDEKNEIMENLVKNLPNVHFLNRKTVDIDNIRIAGCCLWSKIPAEKEHDILLQMNDSRNIYAEPGRPAVPRDMNAWHKCDTEWLSEQINSAKIDSKDLIVLTHYLPSYRMIHQKYEGHPLNCGFASNLEHMIQSPVRAWLCGHSHASVETKINGVYCALNPHGYPNENRGMTNRYKVLMIRNDVSADAASVMSDDSCDFV